MGAQQLADVSKVTASQVAAAAAANTAFGVDLLTKIRATHDRTPRNIFISPLSVTAALAMTVHILPGHLGYIQCRWLNCGPFYP